jgi:hypothetical protein
VQRASGRDFEDVEVAAGCLVSLVTDDASPSQLAGAALLAFGLVDLRRAVHALGAKGD